MRNRISVQRTAMTAPSRVERVARAICEADGGTPWKELPTRYKLWYAVQARAAIAAADAALAEAGYAIMPKEPTAEMIQAGGDVMLRTTRPLNNALEAWRAMWDAAPKPEVK